MRKLKVVASACRLIRVFQGSQALLFIILWMAPLAAGAKRIAPPLLLPVDDGAYRFVVWNDFQRIKHNLYAGGHVVAYLKTTGEKRWEKYLYQVQVNPKLERDVQDVYLKKMYLEKPNQLVLQNERDEWFVLERRTGSVLDAINFKKQPEDSSVYYGNDDRVEPILAGTYQIEADPSITYGHQTVRATDIPTGKRLWEKRVPVPKVGPQERSRILFLALDGNRLTVNFEDGSSCLMDADTGRILRTSGMK
jgi:outer membrane protein assembly factor BamB